MGNSLCLTPVYLSLFGFLDVFGFFSVRFFGRVRVAIVRVCSVVFVDNLCKSLRKSLWVKSGKVFGFLWKSQFCTILWIKVHKMWEIVESFARSFTHGFFSVSAEFYTFSTGPITTTINILEERI